MKNIAGLALMGALVLATAACNESTREDLKDVNASQRAVYKDEVAKDKYEDELARDRAAKAAAKKRGDRATQAKKSLEIGADKAMIKGKEAEKGVDERILEEDKRDLRN